MSQPQQIFASKPVSETFLAADPLALPHPQEEWALFLDIDGTLSDLASLPELAFIPHDTLSSIASLKSGAVALVSGRGLESVLEMTTPHRFAASGQHGLEVMEKNGEIQSSTPLPKALMEEVEMVAAIHPKIHLENKGASVALHYRNCHEMELLLLGYLRQIALHHPAVILQQGKMVVELRMRGSNKGTAIAAFMRSQPFAGKLPVFIGDDATDETGFELVNAMGGLSIKVGEGETAATYRIATPAKAREWLSKIISELNAFPERKIT